MPKPRSKSTKPSQAPAHSSTRRLDWLICLVLVLAALAVYAPVRHFDFVNYDDPDYTSGNAHVRQGLTAQNLEWALTSRDAANWFPLTWVSHMIDCQIFGLERA